jgi:hypothetical protein
MGAGRLHHVAQVLQVPVEFFFEGVGETKSAQPDRNAVQSCARPQYAQARSGRALRTGDDGA